MSVQLYLNDNVNIVNCFGLFVCIIVVSIVLLVRLRWAWIKTTWSAFVSLYGPCCLIINWLI